MSENRIVEKGQYYLHFKHENDNNLIKHIYKIICIGFHSETKEKMVVYQNVATNKICIRPYDMFISDVDKNKYPNIKQKERFRLITFDTDIEYYLDKSVI